MVGTKKEARLRELGRERGFELNKYVVSFFISIPLIIFCLISIFLIDTPLLYTLLGILWMLVFGVYYKGWIVMALFWYILASLWYIDLDFPYFIIVIILPLIVGGIIFVQEAAVFEREIKDRFIETYKKNPLKIEGRIVLGLTGIGIFESRRVFGNSSLLYFDKLSIKTEEGWMFFYYDRKNKKLIER